jgi:hypothetical protein
MPCQKSSTFSAPFSGQARSVQATSGPFATEAECNQACKDGACCEGTTCSVKPQCQCQGTGKVFQGVGTTCATGTCCCPNVATVSVTISNFESYYEFPRLSPNGTWTLSHDSGTCDSWSYLQTLQSYSCPDASTVGGPANPLLSIGISSQGLGLIAADCTQIQATVSDSSFMSKVCSGTSFSGTTESATSFGRVIYRFSYAVGNPLP